MNHQRLINALTKTGATVTNDQNRFHATKGTHLVVWYRQEDSAVCVCTPSPHTDIMTDCFCDYFHRTLRSAVAEMN